MLVCASTLNNCLERVGKNLQPMDMEAFEGWGAQLKTSLPIVLVVTASFWSSNVLLFMAGNMGVSSIAAMAVPNTCQNILSMVFMGV